MKICTGFYIVVTTILSARFYGLPKIHKTRISLRPIVSLINSPTYHVSSYLAKILSPVVGNTVKNSLEFADFIRGKTLDAEDESVVYLSTSFLSLSKYQLI